MAQKPELQDVRCHKCHKLLCKVEHDALKPGKFVEIKCRECGVMNYSMGEDAAA